MTDDTDLAAEDRAVAAHDADGDVDRDAEDVDAVTTAVLTASRLLVAVSVRSLNAAQTRVTVPQFRMLVVLSTHGETKLIALAEDLGVNPSTAMRMAERLDAAGLIDRRVNPAMHDGRRRG